MNMVERVARSICWGRERWSEFHGYDVWDTIGARDRENYMADAKTAIASMRDPTEAMKEAADRDNTYYGHVATNKYRAMINAALKEAE